MKIVCSKNSLLKGLNTVSRAVPVRTTLDILKCILIKADPEGITLTANDTTKYVSGDIQAESLETAIEALEQTLDIKICK